MGAERRVVFDLINVVQGVAKLSQALIRDRRLENLWLLPASQTRDKDALTDEGVGSIIADLRTKFDWILCDSPAGIERGALLAMRYADEAVIVTNPEVSSVRDSDRIIGMLDSKTVKAERGERVEKHVLITRYDSARASRGEMLSIDDILEILATPLLGIIPESQEVLVASNVGSPVTLNNAASAPARAYTDAVRRLMGETVTMTVPVERKSCISRLPDVEDGKGIKCKFKTYPIGYFHIDIAEVRTAMGRLYLFVAIDRTSKFAFTELHEKARGALRPTSCGP